MKQTKGIELPASFNVTVARDLEPESTQIPNSLFRAAIVLRSRNGTRNSVSEFRTHSSEFFMHFSPIHSHDGDIVEGNIKPRFARNS